MLGYIAFIMVTVADAAKEVRKVLLVQNDDHPLTSKKVVGEVDQMLGSRLSPGQHLGWK